MHTGAQRLVELSLQLGRTHRLQDTLQTVASAMRELLNADRAFVILTGDRIAAKAYAPGASGLPSLSVVKFAVERGMEVVAADIGNDSSLSGSQSVMEMKLGTVVCVPLTDGAEVLGALYADSQDRARSEIEEEVWLARAFASHAAVALRRISSIQRLKRRNRSIREAAHDIRNLLGGLQMGLSELDEIGISEEAREVRLQIGQMASLALDTANTALTTKREPAKAVDLADIVARGIELTRVRARVQSVVLESALNPVRVQGVEGELARVISNLLGNAMKYTPTGSTVRITLHATSHHAVLAVEDEGPGIPEEQRAAVLKSGIQAPNAREGLGLGLGICTSIVKRHGGRVRILDGAVGARFEVELPLL